MCSAPTFGGTKLRDNTAKTAILRRIDRAEKGNFGDSRYLRDGVSEMRINLGPGYRVYYFQHEQALVVILGGGDKQSQGVDINTVISRRSVFLKRYKR